MATFNALKTKEVHSGVIHKVGGRVKSWHKRWMILKSDHSLQYFKDTSKSPLGTISLKDAVFNIRTGDADDFSWPKNCSLENTLVITTSGRVYYMFAESLNEAEEWIRVIRESRASSGVGIASTLPNRYNKMGGKAAQLSMPSAVPTDPTHTPKQYKKKDRRQPTKRFNSLASSHEDLSGVDSDDIETDDGQLNPLEYTQSAPVDSLLNSNNTQIEGVYDLVTQSHMNHTSKDTPTHLSPSTSGGRERNESTNSLGVERDLKDSVCINESLYDLVGRINAGEGDTPLVTPNQEGEGLELYEPVGADIEEVKINNSISKSSIQSLPLPSLPAPLRQTEQFYDAVPEVQVTTVEMYEDVEREDGLKEAESSDDEDTVPLPTAMIPRISPPPPLPPRVGEETYDNAPPLPTKGTKIEESPSEDYYGNVSTPYSKAPPPSSPVSSNETTAKRPKPLPRTGANYSPAGSSRPFSDSAINSTAMPIAAISIPGQEEVYDDIVGLVDTSTKPEVNGIQTRDTANLRTTASTTSEPGAVVILRGTQAKVNGRRAHSATVGADTGIEMFFRRAQELNVVSEEESGARKQVKSLMSEEKQAILSSEDKVILAETLREIETEKQLASEERFKWERERLKFEEDRKKFEKEKQELLNELAKAKAQAQMK